MKITPYECVGPIKFGQPRAIVRQILGSRPFVGKRDESDPVTYDLYNELGCFVYYDSDEKVTSLELFRPGSATLNRVNLLSMSFIEAVNWLKTNDTHVQLELGCCTSFDLGVSVWTDGEEAELVESVLVFERDYFADETSGCQ